MLFALPYEPFAIASFDMVFWLNILFVCPCKGAAVCIVCFLKKAGVKFKCCCDGDVCLDDFSEDAESSGNP